jgi:hypothetical protein
MVMGLVSVRKNVEVKIGMKPFRSVRAVGYRTGPKRFEAEVAEKQSTDQASQYLIDQEV